MPHYGFRCPECLQEIDKNLTIADYTEFTKEGNPVCGECGAELKRIWSPLSIQIN